MAQIDALRKLIREELPTQWKYNKLDVQRSIQTIFDRCQCSSIDYAYQL